MNDLGCLFNAEALKVQSRSRTAACALIGKINRNKRVNAESHTCSQELKSASAQNQDAEIKIIIRNIYF